MLCNSNQYDLQPELYFKLAASPLAACSPRHMWIVDPPYSRLRRSVIGLPCKIELKINGSSYFSELYTNISNVPRTILCSSALLIGDLSVSPKYLYQQYNLYIKNCFVIGQIMQSHSRSEPTIDTIYISRTASTSDDVFLDYICF